MSDIFVWKYFSARISIIIRQVFRMNKSLRGQALYREVFEYIKGYIIENNLNPGDPIPSEGQLVEALGVGRSSVREAVKSLQSLGIIEVIHGNGLFVRELNFDPMLETFKFGMKFDDAILAELLQIRIWLETAVIGDAVERISEKELSLLDVTLEKWESCLKNGKSHIGLDEEFHFILYSVIGNETMMRLFDAFWIAFASLENKSIPEADPYIELQSHHQILEAVKLRDTAMARKKLLNHFHSIQKWVDNYSSLASSETKVVEG